MRRTLLTAVVLGGMGLACACNSPMRSGDLPATPYERYQSLRQQDHVNARPGLGRPDEQELRRRLGPLEPY